MRSWPANDRGLATVRFDRALAGLLVLAAGVVALRPTRGRTRPRTMK